VNPERAAQPLLDCGDPRRFSVAAGSGFPVNRGPWPLRGKHEEAAELIPGEEQMKAPHRKGAEVRDDSQRLTAPLVTIFGEAT
jgi:hypothetical protein